MGHKGPMSKGQAVLASPPTPILGRATQAFCQQMSVANFRSFLFHCPHPPALAHENTQVFTGQLLAVIGVNYMVQAPGARNARDMTFPQARKEPSIEQGWADPGGEGGKEGLLLLQARRPEDRWGETRGWGNHLQALPQSGWDVLHTP